MGITKRADTIQRGDIIDYRGHRAYVIDTQDTAAPDGIRYPVWFVIEWTDEQGHDHLTRLVWPEVPIDELPGKANHTDPDGFDPEAFAATLAEQLETLLVTMWG